jgi:hypothetical protein
VEPKPVVNTHRMLHRACVGESDGKTGNAQHVLAHNPFTLAVLKAYVEQLAGSGTSSARITWIMACCSAGRMAGDRIPTRSRSGSEAGRGGSPAVSPCAIRLAPYWSQ